MAQAALRSPQGPIVGKGTFGAEPSDTNIFVQAVKVRVDPETGKVQLLRSVQALDVGRAINITQCEGQTEGGAVQSLSWALMEELQYDEQGRLINPTFADYRIPTACDIPALETILTEFPAQHGPYGAKGIGEPPITAGLAAVASAIGDATGVWMHEAPMTPERVAFALSQAFALPAGEGVR